jgi:hypothetical protein
MCVNRHVRLPAAAHAQYHNITLHHSLFGAQCIAKITVKESRSHVPATLARLARRLDRVRFRGREVGPVNNARLFDRLSKGFVSPRTREAAN